MSENLPDLKFINIEQLVSHEAPNDIRIQRLIDQIRKEGILRNPIIAARMPGSDKYMILDGVSRVEAFRELGYRDIVAQIVEYDNPRIKVSSFCWMIANITAGQLLERLQHKGIELTKISRKGNLDKIPNIKDAGCIHFRNGESYSISDGSDSLRDRLIRLEYLADSFNGIFEVHIISPPADPAKLFSRYPKGNALLILPSFNKMEITEMVGNELKLPYGITSHQVPDRVLGISIPISIASSDAPLEEKNAYILELFKLRLSRNQARYYPESVFILND
ncbi:MAG: hypothetical protein GF307_08005 [candidate division Zixibacteria bacterium]|nr:hypothetical protein [candidate division Zixibacteria bacterium]